MESLYPIYLDYASTTPIDPEVIDVMKYALSENFGNASNKFNIKGREAKAAVEDARNKVSQLINSYAHEIIFTSGTTESINFALKGISLAQNGKNHIITVSTEHEAVLDVCRYLESIGFAVTFLPVNPLGIIDISELKRKITDATFLISVMLVNNETGVTQPIREIMAVAKEFGILTFCDATQAVGKTVVDVKELDVDLLAFSSHKIYGPKGIGALYISGKLNRRKLTPLHHGGGQEDGLRSGTLNTSSIIGFGAACEICRKNLNEDLAHYNYLGEKLQMELLKIEGTSLNGSKKDRIPNIVNIAFEGIDSEELITSIGDEICLSTKASCSSENLEPSHVLRAYSLPKHLLYASIRFSIGRFTTEHEIAIACRKITELVTAYRRSNPSYT